MLQRMTGSQLQIKVRNIRNIDGKYGHELGGRNITVFHHVRLTHVSPRMDGDLHFSGHILYRMFDDLGKLLYIGITSDLTRRCAQHSARDWWPKVQWITIDREHYSREDLAEAETRAISLERPFYNIEDNPSGWGRSGLAPFGYPQDALRDSSSRLWDVIDELRAIHSSDRALARITQERRVGVLT